MISFITTCHMFDREPYNYTIGGKLETKTTFKDDITRGFKGTNGFHETDRVRHVYCNFYLVTHVGLPWILEHWKIQVF